jgi:membrane associated rhomboid family serine protease
MELVEYLQYNSVLILTFFFLSFGALILKYVTFGKSNKLIFSTYRSSLLNPLTYVRFFTHILGHSDWKHFSNNFLYILLIGPMIEEKYGTINLLIMILITAGVTAIINHIIGRKRLLGASGIVFMLIMMSSFVNIQIGKIPITLILIFVFYIVNEIIDGVLKKDDISHIGHIIGAICGTIFGFLYFYTGGNLFVF